VHAIGVGTEQAPLPLHPAAGLALSFVHAAAAQVVLAFG
jgi:hypothetical protein